MIVIAREVNVKKIMSLLLIAFMLCPIYSAFGVTDEEFVEAKQSLLMGYNGTETEAINLQNLFAKEGKNMPAQEQAMLLVTNAEFEIPRLAIKEVLALVTLQAAQESTPAEAQKLLIDACLDAADLLKALIERFAMRMYSVSNEEAKEIIKTMITINADAITSVKTLQTFIEGLQ